MMAATTVLDTATPAAEANQAIAELNRKLDWITGELQAQRHYRLALEDLEADLTLVSRVAFADLTKQMEEFEQKGYFRFGRQMAGIAETLVSTHSSQDLDQARASIPQLIGFLRELTRPEVLQALEAIVYGFGEVQAGEKKDVSLAHLVREGTSAEARRGLDIIVRFLKVIGARSAKEERKTK